MITIKKGLLLGVLTYFVFLLVIMPASFPVQFLKAESYPSVHLTQVGGTLWKGQAAVEFESEQYQLSWDLNPWSLLLLQLSATFDLRHEQISLSGILVGSVSGVGVMDVSGFVGDQYLAKLGQDFNVSIENSMRVDGIELFFDGQAFGNVSGALRWEGGLVSYKAGRKIKSVQVPALKATLGLEGEALLLTVLTQDNGAELTSLNLTPQGMASVVVRRRLLDVVGQRWGQEVDPDFVVFEIQEQLLN